MPKKEPIKGKKIAMVIAFRDFRDIEYFVPKEIFEAAGATTLAVSTEDGTAIGADGGEVNIFLAASRFNIGAFDAVVFIGGPGMGKEMDNKDFQKIAKSTVEAGKVLGSICISPTILAKAGVLSGKKATVWSSTLDKSAINILQENGAIYEAKSVVVDGNIITAMGPIASKSFAEQVVSVLEKQ